MERKLIKQGGGGYTIYLPKKWVERNKLDKGNEISLIEEENKLTIKSKYIETHNVASIDVSNLSPLVNRSLIALYIKGIDEIIVKFNSKADILDFQKRVVSELLGFEIIKQSANELIIRDVTGSEYQELDDLIKRVFLILDSIFEELIFAIKNKKGFDDISLADASVNRLCHFCLRILNKRGYKEYDRTSQIYGIVNLLEEIGDDVKKISLFKDKRKFNKDFIKKVEDSRELLSSFKDLLFNFSKEEAVKSALKYEKIRKSLSGDALDSLTLQLIEDIIKINNYLLVFSLGKE